MVGGGMTRKVDTGCKDALPLAAQASRGTGCRGDGAASLPSQKAAHPSRTKPQATWSDHGYEQHAGPEASEAPSQPKLSCQSLIPWPYAVFIF